MVKRRYTRKGKGWFHKKKSRSRKSNKLSDVNYNKEKCSTVRMNIS